MVGLRARSQPMARSITGAGAAHVESTVLAMCRNWGSKKKKEETGVLTHAREPSGSSAVKQVVKALGRLSSAKGLFSPRVLENRDFVLKRLSLPELSAALVVSWQCLLWLPDG